MTTQDDADDHDLGEWLPAEWVSVSDRMPEPHTEKSSFLTVLEVFEDTRVITHGSQRIGLWVDGAWSVYEMGGSFHRLDEGFRIVAWKESHSPANHAEVVKFSEMIQASDSRTK